jgi:hypothetical protein
MKKHKRRASKQTSLTSLTRSKLLIVAAIVVGLSSIAYAAYSQVLTVNGSGTATGTWDVAITSITETASDGKTNNSAPSFTGTSATFDVDLAYPGAYAEYDVVVTNAGNIPAILSSITDLTTKNAEAPTYITYTVSNVTAGTTTLGTSTGVDDTNTIHVRVEWTGGTSPDTSSGNTKSATIDFTYDQNTN